MDFSVTYYEFTDIRLGLQLTFKKLLYIEFWKDIIEHAHEYQKSHLSIPPFLTISLYVARFPSFI